MRFQNLDLNLLAALDKLIRLQSVSRAAEELSITQSAMSNALNRLRQYFDDPLLVQIGRRMELTPRAEALSGPVRDILVRIEAAVATPPDFDPATSTRTITIMVSDYSLATVMPVFARTLAREAPLMKLTIKAQQSFPAAQLERGDTDLLIAPQPYSSPDHPSEHLVSDPMVCVLDADNPISQRLDLETFAKTPQVAMLPSGGGRSFAALMLEKVGIEVTTVATTFAFTSLGDLVRGTDRLAMVQSRLAERMVKESGGLVAVPLPLEFPPLVQVVQWHSMRDTDPALLWTREQLHAAVNASIL